MNLTTEYFAPFNRIARCELDQLKLNPLTALIILSYFTIAAPLFFLGLSYLAGRVQEADLSDPNIEKVDSVSKKTLGDAHKIYQQGQSCRDGSFGYIKDVVKGFEFIKKAADMGLAEAQNDLGYLYGNGIGTEKNYEEAFKHYSLAAKNGISCALYNLGIYFEHGLGCEKDDAKAVDYYQKAANSGFQNAFYELALRHEFGRGVNKDPVLAFNYMKSAVSSFNSKAQVALGKYYRDGFGCQIDHKAANTHFQNAIIYHNDPVAHYYLGCEYEFGDGIEQDEKKAFEHYKKAVDLGYIYANAALGKAYYKGLGIDVNDIEAFKCMNLAYEVRNHSSFVNLHLGIFYRDAIGTERNLEKAEKHLLVTLNTNHPDAIIELVTLALCYLEENEQKAFKLMSFCAEKSDARAHYHLAVMYEFGQGTDKDIKEAVLHYTIAADQGDAHAQYALGIQYLYGKDVAKDRQRGFELIQKASDELVQANSFLGYMYYEGIGTAINLEKAFENFKEAADVGDEYSLYMLGLMYGNGEGVAKDLEKQFHYHLLAAKEGFSRAKRAVGFHYINGDGVAVNADEAIKWLTEAANQDDPHAIDTLILIYQNGKLVPKDEIKAQTLAKRAEEIKGKT